MSTAPWVRSEIVRRLNRIGELCVAELQIPGKPEGWRVYSALRQVNEALGRLEEPALDTSGMLELIEAYMRGIAFVFADSSPEFRAAVDKRISNERHSLLQYVLSLRNQGNYQ